MAQVQKSDGTVVEVPDKEIWGPPKTQEQFDAERRPQVKTERDRRITAGSRFPVTGITDPIPLTGRMKDQTVYLALLQRAQGFKAAGVTGAVLTVRDRDDVIHNLTPDQMVELVSAAMSWFEDVMKFSWDMIDGRAPFESGIPEDFAAHPDWP